MHGGCASTSSLVREALSLKDTVLKKPTSFLYTGAVAQQACSTTGMYGELKESSIKKVGRVSWLQQGISAFEVVI